MAYMVPVDERGRMDQDGTAGVASALLLTSTAWIEGFPVATAAGSADAGNNHQLPAALGIAMRPDRPLIADLSGSHT